MLVDAGDSDAGPRIVSALRSRGVSSIDAAVASHAHADHIGGYQTLLSTFPVGVFYDAGYPSTSATYERLLLTIEQKDIRYVAPTRGQTIALDPAVRIEVLSPDGSGRGEIHDNMLVLRLSYGTFSALLTGDMPSTLEQDIGASLRPTTVVKVGHHGSRTSTSTSFLNVVRPKVAVISVGAGNSYGHPTAEVLQRLKNVGATTYRTDQSGTVTVSSDGTTYTVTTARSGGAAVPVATTLRQTTRGPSAPVAAPGSSSVAITAVDLKGETVTITNGGTSTAGLSGWKLTDQGAKHTYSFTGTSLPPGGSVVVASGPASGDVKWTTANVWNNDGDTAYLYDSSGALVSQKRG
jgi:beta-lactamase superfamily II metal-dependent hydrolase